MAVMFCTQCHTQGTPATKTKGSVLIEIVLWLFICLPGLVYSLWRMTSRERVCKSCGSAMLVPLNSPAARAALGPGSKS